MFPCVLRIRSISVSGSICFHIHFRGFFIRFRLCKKYENKYDSTRFPLFQLRFYPYSCHTPTMPLWIIPVTMGYPLHGHVNPRQPETWPSSGFHLVSIDMCGMKRWLLLDALHVEQKWVLTTNKIHEISPYKYAHFITITVQIKHHQNLPLNQIISVLRCLPWVRRR